MSQEITALHCWAVRLWNTSTAPHPHWHLGCFLRTVPLGISEPYPFKEQELLYSHEFKCNLLSQQAEAVLALGAGSVCALKGVGEPSFLVHLSHVFFCAMHAVHLPQNNSLSVHSDLSNLKYCFTERQGKKLILSFPRSSSHLTCSDKTEAQLH